MTIKEMKDDDLIARVKEAHSAVEADCFSVRDILLVEHGARELELRGYTIDTSSELIISMES